MQPIAVKLVEVQGKPVNEICALIGWRPRVFGDGHVLLIRSNGDVEQHRLSDVRLNSTINIVPMPAGALHRV